MYERFLEEFPNGPSRSLNLGKEERVKIFSQTLKEIVEHNANPANSWKKGINEFSDMTEQEFMDHFQFTPNDQDCSATHNAKIEGDVVGLPEHWDWRNFDGVSPVKNQGGCGDGAYIKPS